MSTSWAIISHFTPLSLGSELSTNSPTPSLHFITFFFWQVFSSKILPIFASPALFFSTPPHNSLSHSLPLAPLLHQLLRDLAWRNRQLLYSVVLWTRFKFRYYGNNGRTPKIELIEVRSPFSLSLWSSSSEIFQAKKKKSFDSTPACGMRYNHDQRRQSISCSKPSHN